MSIYRKSKKRALTKRLFVQATSLDQDFSDGVRIAVGRRSAIFQISAFLLSTISWNSNGAATIGHTSREIVNGRSLMKTSQTPLVILAFIGVIGLDVADMVSGELVNGLLDGNQAIGLSHGQS